MATKLSRNLVDVVSGAMSKEKRQQRISELYGRAHHTPVREPRILTQPEWCPGGTHRQAQMDKGYFDELRGAGRLAVLGRPSPHARRPSPPRPFPMPSPPVPRRPSLVRSSSHRDAREPRQAL